MLSLFLFSQNPAKSVVLIVLCAVWLTSQVLTSFSKISLINLIFVFIVLPFNLTFQMPIGFAGLSPYSNGIYVNFLHPFLSILDVAIVIFALFGVIDILKYITKKWIIFVGLGFGLLFVHNLYFLDLNVLINSLRLFLYAVSGGIFYLLWDKSFLGEQGERLKQLFLRSIFFVLISSSLFQGLLGILQFVNGKSLGLSFLGESIVSKSNYLVATLDLFGNVYLRAYGLFPHPNVLSAFLLLAVFYALFVGKSLFKRQKTYVIPSLVISLLLLFTASKIAIFLLVCVWFQFIYIHKQKSTSSASYSLFAIEVQSITNWVQSSLSQRVHLMNGALSVIKDNLWLGVGAGNLTLYLPGYISVYYDGRILLQPVHNIFLLFLSEYGFLIFITVCGLYLLSFFNKLRNVDNALKDQSTKDLIFSYTLKRKTLLKIAGLAIFVALGMFDHYLLSLPQGIAMSAMILVYTLL